MYEFNYAGIRASTVDLLVKIDPSLSHRKISTPYSTAIVQVVTFVRHSNYRRKQIVIMQNCISFTV